MFGCMVLLTGPAIVLLGKLFPGMGVAPLKPWAVPIMIIAAIVGFPGMIYSCCLTIYYMGRAHYEEKPNYPYRWLYIRPKPGPWSINFQESLGDFHLSGYTRDKKHLHVLGVTVFDRIIEVPDNDVMYLWVYTHFRQDEKGSPGEIKSR